MTRQTALRPREADPPLANETWADLGQIACRRQAQANAPSMTSTPIRGYAAVACEPRNPSHPAVIDNSHLKIGAHFALYNRDRRISFVVIENWPLLRNPIGACKSPAGPSAEIRSPRIRTVSSRCQETRRQRSANARHWDHAGGSALKLSTMTSRISSAHSHSL
jgi:hypothetical protein